MLGVFLSFNNYADGFGFLLNCVKARGIYDGPGYAKKWNGDENPKAVAAYETVKKKVEEVWTVRSVPSLPNT